ncbi:DUF1311 domain-containing protein [Clostridium aestuarii]|uniref:DUF1311 domain-containing protein n=1 Tax=Clostridium aestuarii TaxID=338193 RepID=A0ABT4D3S0_9CLOT|nr:lysozyme inhibitor LprI family protein [Clostridium aestuarii]MCY6485879.1 DUF1311 domain-containing protein [Clostridium aestuarii]
MKKIIGIIMLSIFLVLGLAGCGNSVAKEVIKQDKEALQEKQIDEDIKTNEAINNDIKKITTLYNDKKYEDAKKLISELNNKKLNDNQKEEINNMNDKIDAEIKKIEDKENTKKEKNKKFYIEKLDNIETGLKDLSELYAGSNAQMIKAASEEYKRWDDALNEIYGVLKKQLSASDMNKLKKEQIQWIPDKKKIAEEAAEEFKGGSMAPLVYASSLAQTTKDRCYELIEKYMK